MSKPDFFVKARHADTGSQMKTNIDAAFEKAKAAFAQERNSLLNP
jgi:hypothetical protein